MIISMFIISSQCWSYENLSHKTILLLSQLPGRLFSPRDISKKLSRHFLLHFPIGTNLIVLHIPNAYLIPIILWIELVFLRKFRAEILNIMPKQEICWILFDMQARHPLNSEFYRNASTVYTMKWIPFRLSILIFMHLFFREILMKTFIIKL